MGRQIPKNVRQIGNVSDNSKIYIEDYVDIFLNQLSEKSSEKITGAFLVGETTEESENDYIYIHGCIHMRNPVVKGKDLIIEEEEWKYACETCKEYFGDAEILGWVMVGGEQPFEMTHNIQKMHQKYFQREKSVFMFKNCRDKEEKLFIYKYREMMEVRGHYIFYEKNVEMQDYMIASRKNAGLTPSETLDDQAAKSFRSIIQEKMEKKEQRARFRPAYILVMGCTAFLLITGVNMMQRYKNMQKPADDMEPIQEVVSDQTIAEENDVPVIELEPPMSEETVGEIDIQLEDQQESQETSGIQMEEIYIVKKGDTLASISKEVYGDIARITDICELNGLGDGNLIMVGQKLLLP